MTFTRGLFTPAPPTHPPKPGCTHETDGKRCDTQDTVWLSGRVGRRCSAYPPEPIEESS